MKAHPPLREENDKRGSVSYLFILSLSIFSFFLARSGCRVFSQPLHGGARRTMKLFSGLVGGRRPEREEEGGGICKAVMMKGEQSACYSHR